MRRMLWILLVAAMACTCAAGADWPKFLGPDGTGASPSTCLARSWPAEGPKELWRLDVSVGFGSAAIEGSKAYFTDRVAGKQEPLKAVEVVKCVDLATGKEDWKLEYEAPAPRKFDYPGARAMPTVDDKYVYTIGAVGDVYCTDKKSGAKVWNKNLLTDFGAKLPQWAVSTAPVLYKGWVLLAPQGKTVGLAAVKKDTGEVVWKGEPCGSMAYCTPLIAKAGDVEQALMLNHSGLHGVRLADGKVLWSLKMGGKEDIKKDDAWVCGIPIPSPTDLGGGKFFVTGGYKGGSVIVTVTGSGDKFEAKIAKKLGDVGSHIQNAVLYKDHLYVNSGDAGVNADNKPLGLACLDLEGNVKWKTAGKPNLEKGSLLIADGLIFVVGGGDGMLYLAEARPDGYKELGKFKGLEGKEAWAPLALGGGKLIGRDKKQLKCWDVSAAK